jgi:hypothetical protein
VVVFLSACGGSSGAGDEQGIRGTTVAGPACGGPVREDSPCPDRPVQVQIDLFTAGFADEVATTRSDDQGRFAFDDLAPGDYVLQVATDASPFPNGPPMNVHVVAGQYTEVTMQLDTGIR